jgi:peptide/nickel transport system substrate-binding protein
MDKTTSVQRPSPRRVVRVTSWVLCLAVVGLAASGASATASPARHSRAESAVGKATTAAATPRRGGTLTVGILGDATGLDPAKTPDQPSGWLDQLVYSYLVRTNAKLKIVPDLATKWTRPSSTRYIFTLRTGVHFQNGRLLTSADVKYSLDRLRNPATGSENLLYYSGIQAIKTSGPYKIEIDLSKPDATFLTHLASPTSAIVPKEVVAKYGDLQKTMLGSGPFEFVSYTPETATILKRNPHYYVKGVPYLSQLVIRPIEDPTARINALLSGGVDLIDFIPPNEIGSLKSVRGISVGPGQSGQFYFLMMFSNYAPLNKVDVRQAISYAIDRQAIVQAALFGTGTPLYGGPIPSWSPYGLKTALYKKPNLAKAKSLMKAAKVSGFSTTIGLWSGQPYAVTAAEVIQQELAPLGIHLKITQYGDYSSYSAAVFTGAQDGMTIQGYGGNIDPDDWVDRAFHTGGGLNFAKYSNSTVDKLLDQAKQTLSTSKRKKLYDQAQMIIARTGPDAFLFNQSQPDAWRSNVHGFQHRRDVTLAGLITTWVSK